MPMELSLRQLIARSICIFFAVWVLVTMVCITIINANPFFVAIAVFIMLLVVVSCCICGAIFCDESPMCHRYDGGPEEVEEVEVVTEPPPAPSYQIAPLQPPSQIDNTCKICYANAWGTVLECGHPLCGSCVSNIKKGDGITCPFCKAVSKGATAIYAV